MPSSDSCIEANRAQLKNGIVVPGSGTSEGNRRTQMERLLGTAKDNMDWDQS